jgi:16S rRNA (guanine1207-N2)-methyltransferase
MPKGRAVWEQTVRDAAHVLRKDGDLYLAGAKNAGIKTAARFLERIFGAVSVLAYKGGCRVLRAVKGAESEPEAGSYYAWSTVDARVGDEEIAYTSKPGIFSWEKVDDGTRLLVETLQDHPLQAGDQVLDMGCGTGVLTLVAARQAHAGHVVGLDADCRAVEATRRTIAHNSIPNAEAKLSDCGQAVLGRHFTAVVTNPPFHHERATTYFIAEQIIREAAALLQRRGRLYLVANSFLKYGQIVEEAFGNAEVLRQTSRFKVWHATKKR